MAQRQQSSYIHGSAVPQVAPKPRRKEKVESTKVSVNTLRNRKKAKAIGREYAFFITIAVVVVFLICATCIWSQMHLSQQKQQVISLQKKLTSIEEDNKNEYDKIMNSVNLDEIRKKAEEAGMTYATKDQVIEYNAPINDYVQLGGGDKGGK
jgi:cell division protein FtsL